ARISVHPARRAHSLYERGCRPGLLWRKRRRGVLPEERAAGGRNASGLLGRRNGSEYTHCGQGVRRFIIESRGLIHLTFPLYWCNEAEFRRRCAPFAITRAGG